MSVPVKKCTICKKHRLKTEFCKNASMADGKHNQCKICAKRLWKKYRENNAEKLKAYQQRERAQFPERVRERKAKAVRKPRSRFLDALRVANKRGLVWDISFDDFEKNIKSFCLYCKGPLPETGHGFDRIDNSVGYLIENVVPCCTHCNMLRSGRLTHLEMLVLSEKLVQLRLNRGGTW